jgi:hypothetical protein
MPDTRLGTNRTPTGAREQTMTDRSTVGTPDGTPEDVDPRVAELVVAIRDRFGLRGLRGARWLIEKEIAIAEEAMAGLPAE